MKMSESFLRYSALDAACTKEIHDRFWEELGPFQAAYDLTIKIIPVLMFMQARGVKVNRAALNETKADVLKAAAEKQAELNSLTGSPLNVNSSKQCQEYFYGKLGIPPYKNADGNPCVDDKALARLVRGTAARPGLRQAKLVQEIRGLQKLYSTYLNMEFDADDRMRASYNPRGTKFGRLSSSKTIFGTGTNMQNLPAEFKKFLVPDEGYVFMEFDKRQAEWIVVAYCAGDANMMEAIEKGLDVHTHTACKMFNVTPEIVKKEAKLVGHTSDVEYISEMRFSDADVIEAIKASGKQWPRSMSLRQAGKKSNHGLNYDEGFNGFAMINEISPTDAKVIVNGYHAIYPGIRLWYEHIKRELMKDRCLTNCFGRTVRFLDAWGDSLWKSAYSMIPQSTVVDSLNQGLSELYDDPRVCGTSGANMDILAQVHDSGLTQVPIAWLRVRENYDWLIERIRDATSPMLHYSGRDFKIATDFKFGFGNWGEYNKDKNPIGMQELDTYEDFMAALTVWENRGGEGTHGLAQ